MVEKLASSEIAESRGYLESIRAKTYACRCASCLANLEEAVERDTRERVAQFVIQLEEDGEIIVGVGTHVAERIRGEIIFGGVSRLRNRAIERWRTLAETAQGEIVNLEKCAKEAATDCVEERRRAETAERKLAEQDDQISALKELVERYLGKLAELEKAFDNLFKEVLGNIGFAGPGIRQAIGNTNMQCLQNRLEEAEAALASLRAESKEG